MKKRQTMKGKQQTVRRIACNELVTPDGRRLSLHVVEIREGCVSDLYPLLQETAGTEWVQGSIVLKEGPDGSVRAYYKGKELT